jgi:cell division initiation protein
MSLSPEDIQGKRFHDAFRGYNHEEVDVFLDEVAAAFETVFKSVQAARARVEELEAELDEVKGTEGMLKRTLLAAQRAADEAIAEAKAEAAELVSIAEDQAAAAVASAKRQAEDIIAAANARQTGIEEAESRLQALHAEHRATLRAHLQDQLRALDNLPALPGPEAAPAVSPSAARPAAPAVEVAADAEPLTPPEPEPAHPETPADVVEPRPVSSFSPLGDPVEVEPGEGAGERPPSRREPREPFRPGGPAGISGLVKPVTHTGETD